MSLKGWIGRMVGMGVTVFLHRERSPPRSRILTSIWRELLHLGLGWLCPPLALEQLLQRSILKIRHRGADGLPVDGVRRWRKFSDAKSAYQRDGEKAGPPDGEGLRRGDPAKLWCWRTYRSNCPARYGRTGPRGTVVHLNSRLFSLGFPLT
jgi:hypothetical protein